MSKRAKREAKLAERHEFQTGGILGHDSGEYRVVVTERTAASLDVVAACVQRLAGAVAGAKVGEFRGDEQMDPPSRLARRPMAGMTRREWLWNVTATMALYNVAPIRRVGRDSDGVALSLVPYAPPRLSRVGDIIMIDGKEEANPDEFGYIRRCVWPTLSDDIGSILKLAREVIAAAWAQSAYSADFWENGGAPQVILATDQPLTDTEATTIRDRYTKMRRENPGAPVVVGKGAKPQPFGVDLGQTGVGDAGDRLLASLARYLGIPPWLVNVPTAAGSMVYSNTRDAGLDLATYTLADYTGPIGDFLSDELPGDYILGRRIDIDVSHLYRGTMMDQYQAYQIALGNKPFMSVTEVRRNLHLPADMGLDPAGAPAPALEMIGGPLNA